MGSANGVGVDLDAAGAVEGEAFASAVSFWPDFITNGPSR
jgi:hypothetical protein